MDKDTKNTIRLKFNEFVINTKKKPAEIARELCIDSSQFSKMVNGKLGISSTTLRKIEEIYGIDYNWFLGTEKEGKNDNTLQLEVVRLQEELERSNKRYDDLMELFKRVTGAGFGAVRGKEELKFAGQI